MMLPKAAFQDIIDATGAQYNDNYGLYQLSCKSKFQWTITLGGHDFILDETSGILQVQKGVCLLAFDTYDASYYDYILAGPFASSFCTVSY
jgi:hypothetical protein